MHAPGRIAGAFASLARQGASGALEISGNPGGIAYFDDGNLTFVESAAVPDLGSRLIYSGRLAAPQWARVAEDSRPGVSAADILLSRGLVTADELRGLLESIATDALLALAVPLAADSFTASTSFVPRSPHWAATLLRMDAMRVWAHVEEAAARLARLDVPPGACPRLCDLARPWAVVSRGEWLMACQIDGRVTVADLARGNGLALHETVRRVSRLARAGLCTIAGPGDHLAARPRHPEPLALGAAPATAPGSGLPRRRPGSGSMPAKLDHAVLRQVLAGLESLGKPPEGSAGHRNHDDLPS